jgi:hypothetical protein
MSACSSSLPTVSACWLAVFVVLDRYLALAVGPQIGQLAVLAHLAQLPR